jgi:hypothetical protein
MKSIYFQSFPNLAPHKQRVVQVQRINIALT